VPLNSVQVFRYLGRPLSSTDDDWPAVYRNLSRARERWRHVSRVLVRDGADAKSIGKFYVVVVMAVLLYGAESWVFTVHIRTTLAGFHNRIVRRIVGMQRRLVQGRFESPPLDDAYRATGLKPIDYYIENRQRTVLRSVVGRPILQLVRNTVRRTGTSHRQIYWWDRLVQI